MQQFSSQGTSAELQILSGHLLFIDPLYLDTIKDEYGQLQFDSLKESVDFVQMLEERFFPYGGANLLGYKYTDQRPMFALAVQRIQFFDHDDEEQERLSIDKTITTFGTDSGSLLILDIRNFEALLDTVTGEDLSDAEDDFQPYADRINQLIGNKGWAYIRCPGVDSGFDFIGSGSYHIAD
ncbi:hypothetical protein SAMN02745146_0637 [Hymenobacter daecheongensis DSM 21074]|uniref:Uncharacterized protein n=1 Tax=Hymenobacter daecheongensis DSM 21074 TaxID=1121955 RepID=A0A1M6AGZ7_9BACT|nr:hypothetical protein [Hymenobacter daecheongensis]SHI35806.1 hypothetical protein SAMN02745146_0637 [Hymenobacter daecheongensis DSM 21074]